MASENQMFDQPVHGRRYNQPEASEGKHCKNCDTPMRNKYQLQNHVQLNHEIVPTPSALPTDKMPTEAQILQAAEASSAMQVEAMRQAQPQNKPTDLFHVTNAQPQESARSLHDICEDMFECMDERVPGATMAAFESELGQLLAAEYTRGQNTAHDTADDWCCACDADKAFMEARITAAQSEAMPLTIEAYERGRIDGAREQRIKDIESMRKIIHPHHDCEVCELRHRNYDAELQQLTKEPK